MCIVGILYPGSYPCSAWIDAVTKRGITVSMDSKGRCLDNVYIERFWRSAKQEEVYLKVYDDVHQAREGIKKYIEFYNHQRPHQSLDYKTPAEVYFASNLANSHILNTNVA